MLTVVAVVAAVVVRQGRGSPLRLRRVLSAPVALVGMGLFTGVGLGGLAAVRALGPADAALLLVGAAAVAAVGVGQGRTLRLETRGGVLWTRMPPAGLGWWLLLAGLRGAMSLVGPGLGAPVAASSAMVMLLLGVNRLGQAMALVPRARATGVPAADAVATAEGRGAPVRTGWSGSGHPPVDGRSAAASPDPGRGRERRRLGREAGTGPDRRAGRGSGRRTSSGVRRERRRGGAR
ncbi:hypothetical protein ACWEPZ_18975 [Streptomyces sp. NPDC004288]